jgi:Xaa-Pro aminopeptidase
MTGTALDAVARTALEEAGLGEYFTHSLGHGIGLQTHEWPRLSQRVEHVLPEGATVTVEPGVYVPERYGIRIEDIIVLKAEGCENLTAASKELLVL